MRQFGLIGLLITLILVAAGCGSSETKTVTETVTTPAETESPEPSESSSGGAGASDVPTATTIPDGTWKRGEYTPGTYRAPGSEYCYWEKEKQPGELSGLGNGVEETNILLDIDSPYFKTEECGTWEKVE